ncbi:hypothetical protein [Alicyclobacillus tolerans]|nr:hypothetical protein [Alicyclobacillus montanus]
MSMDIKEVEARKMEELLVSDKPIVTPGLVYAHLERIQPGVAFMDVFIDGEFVGMFGTYDTDLPYALHVGEEYASIERKSKTLKIVLANGTELEVRPLDLIYMHKDKAYDMVMNQIEDWLDTRTLVIMNILKCTTEMHGIEAREKCEIEFYEAVYVSNKQRISELVTQFINEAYKGSFTTSNIIAEISHEGIAFDSVARGHVWTRYRIFPSQS